MDNLCLMAIILTIILILLSPKMPMSAAEERRLRRQHRILANSEQRMKLVMGETSRSVEEKPCLAQSC